jgi:hypothetical protein
MTKEAMRELKSNFLCGDGEAAQFWRVLAFSDTAQAELLRLDDGDALAVQGGSRAEAYSKDGELRVGLTVIADAVLPLRRPKKPREPEPQEQQAARAYMMRFRSDSGLAARGGQVVRRTS